MRSSFLLPVPWMVIWPYPYPTEFFQILICPWYPIPCRMSYRSPHCLQLLVVSSMFLAAFYYKAEAFPKDEKLLEERRRISKRSGSDETYNNEKNTCKMKQFDMHIEEKNCTMKTIKNNYCIGYCNSLFIPQYSQTDIKFCRACLPRGRAWKAVNLDCIENGKKITRLHKVRYITSCQCLNVKL